MPCQIARAARISHTLTAFTAKKQVRFITFTLKHCQDPLATQLDRLYDCFRQLRRTVLWKRTVTGGVSFLEVTRSVGTPHTWHPHLHVLTTGKWIHQGQLSDTWKEITGDSHIVDIRMARSVDDMTKYVTKYVTKGFHSSIYRDENALDELIVAFHGRRLCFTFGSFRGLRLLTPSTDTASPDEWQTLGTLGDLISRAEAGNSRSLSILAQLSSDTTWTIPTTDTS